ARFGETIAVLGPYMRALGADIFARSASMIDPRVMTHIAGYFLLYLFVIGMSFNTHDHFYGLDPNDPSSYLLHAFPIGLDGDLNYANEVTVMFCAEVCKADPACHARCSNMNPAGTSPTHPMGSGILAAPFVAAFSVIDRHNHHPVLTN